MEMPSSTSESTKATAKASVFQRDTVSRFMTTLRRMSHRLSKVTKKMALVRPPTHAPRINSLQVTDESAATQRKACDRDGSGCRWAGKDRSQEGGNVRVHG